MPIETEVCRAAPTAGVPRHLSRVGRVTPCSRPCRFAADRARCGTARAIGFGQKSTPERRFDLPSGIQAGSPKSFLMHWSTGINLIAVARAEDSVPPRSRPGSRLVIKVTR